VNTVTMHIGDVRDVMATLPDGHADLLVTSPPFLALRSYLPADHPDKHREIGSEPTPAAFLDTLYGLTADWGRLVPEWGSICVELGDTMSGSGGAGGDYLPGGFREGQPGFGGTAERQREGNAAHWRQKVAHREAWPLAKSMCLMPHAYTIGLAYGMNPLTGRPHGAGQWRIRNVVTWARPNPPVGSLGKRNPEKRTGDYKFRPACSYITIACRGTGRYFDLDAVRTERPHLAVTQGGNMDPRNQRDDDWHRGHKPESGGVVNPAGAPPLDWHTDELDGDWLWKLATAPYPGAHYATYPLALPRRLVLAMCPLEVCTVCGWPRERIVHAERRNPADDRQRRVKAGEYRLNNHDHAPEIGWEFDRTTLGFTDCGHDAYRPGMALDPFGGSGTTAVAAALEGRDATLIDLDARNVDLVRRRLAENVRITGETWGGARPRTEAEGRGGRTTTIGGGRKAIHRKPAMLATRVTWTVEQVAKSEIDADQAGQMDLFAS
jgi:hypothetical protein